MAYGVAGRAGKPGSENESETVHVTQIKSCGRTSAMTATADLGAGRRACPPEESKLRPSARDVKVAGKMRV